MGVWAREELGNGLRKEESLKKEGGELKKGRREQERRREQGICVGGTVSESVGGTVSESALACARAHPCTAAIIIHLFVDRWDTWLILSA